MPNSSPSPPDHRRDYSALPRNALLALFNRIPHADILRAAGLVCASWWRIAVAEPLLWRHIDLDIDAAGWPAMARAAVDRSAGLCESFRGRADDDFLVYLAQRSPSLRSIHVTSSSWFYMSESLLIEAVIRKLPLLERLVVSRGNFHASSEVMRALLDHCPRLELLDVGGCYTDCVIGYMLRARCKLRIKGLRLPKDSPGCCTGCTRYAQKYADKHDY